MEIRTEIIINASAQAVWSVLTQFDKYSEWNPFITKIEGYQSVGETLQVDITPPGGKKMTFTPTLRVIEPAKEMRWVGKMGFSWVFRGEHYFQLEVIDANTTRFIQGELFSGALMPVFSIFSAAQTLAGFEQMNQCLAKAALDVKASATAFTAAEMSPTSLANAGASVEVGTCPFSLGKG